MDEAMGTEDLEGWKVVYSIYSLSRRVINGRGWLISSAVSTSKSIKPVQL